jgi:hypothetical protein
MNANQDTRGFVIHLVARDGAHRGWWRRESPHVVELERAQRFATAYEALGITPNPPGVEIGCRGEVWSLALALEQGVREPAFVPGGLRP